MDSTFQEAETFVNICCKTQELIQDSEEADTLIKLTSYAEHFKKEFSAAGFFYIEKRIIFSIIQHGATYLIVAVQFNGR